MPGKEIKGRSPIANYRDGGRIGFKEGLGVAKRPKKSPGPLGRGGSKFTGPPSQSKPKPKPQPKKEAPPEGGRRPGPRKGPSPKRKPKVEEDWAAKGGRIK